MKIEENAIAKSKYNDISITDIHNIVAIGYETARNMTSVARDLDITVGTLTISINNLVKKGYVDRIRSVKDRRVVLISLSEKGKKVYKYHERFHSKVMAEISQYLDDEETEVLFKALDGLKSFINKNKDKEK
jgi:DNA-binding MarR family transcriptional regulator